MNFPIADICLRYAEGRLSYQRAVRLLLRWAPDRSEADHWLSAAARPRTPGYGELSGKERRHA